MASQTFEHPRPGPTNPLPTGSTHLCGGCGLLLEAGQKWDARHHGSWCRQLAYHVPRRVEVLRALDRIGVEMATLRAEIE